MSKSYLAVLRVLIKQAKETQEEECKNCTNAGYGCPACYIQVIKEALICYENNIDWSGEK